MKNFLMATAAFAIGSFGMWCFKETLSSVMLDKEHMRQQILQETDLTIGRKDPCKTKVSLAVWDSMNELEIYNWVAACEKAQE